MGHFKFTFLKTYYITVKNMKTRFLHDQFRKLRRILWVLSVKHVSDFTILFMALLSRCLNCGRIFFSRSRIYLDRLVSRIYYWKQPQSRLTWQCLNENNLFSNYVIRDSTVGLNEQFKNLRKSSKRIQLNVVSS